MFPFNTSMADQIIRTKLVCLMTTKYAVLTTKQAAGCAGLNDESNNLEQSLFI